MAECLPFCTFATKKYKGSINIRFTYLYLYLKDRLNFYK